MKKLILIDGSSYLFRAFHALPPLTNAQGEPTGALFGVVNMLRGMLKENPDYIAFVMDASGPSFRNEMYAEYKSNRPPTPDDLRAQIPPLMEIVEALGVPLLRISGVEADDVIGTLAVQGEQDGMDVKISTSDKDFAQMVRPGIRLVNTMTGSLLDSDEAVIKKFGVRADQIIDYLALMGDKIDNIPGVDKCGPKTAAKWLEEYGTLDNIIANADAFKGKVGEYLRDAVPRLPLNQALTTIKTDVGLELTPADLTRKEPNVEKLTALFTRYGMKQALKELTGGDAESAKSISEASAASSYVAEAPEDKWAAKGEYECVLTSAALDAWVAKLSGAKEFVFDVETDALDPMQANLVGISLSVEPFKAAYIPLAHQYPGVPEQLPKQHVLSQLAPIFNAASIHKIGQHGKYDLHVLRREGIEVNGYHDDTMLESFVLNTTVTRHDMDSLAKHYLGYTTTSFTDVAGKGKKQLTFDQVELEPATHYAAEDADITMRLHHVLRPKLDAVPSLANIYRDIEMPLVPVLERIEANGVKLDIDELRKQSQDLASRMLTAQESANAIAGRPINLDSPKQIGELLFNELGLPAVVKTPGGAPSTNEEALEAIADQHELPRLILEYRGLNKLRSTYTDKLPGMVNPQTGRVHTSYHQAGAATGRLASSDPNLQNIPIRTEDGRRIRTAFVAEEGNVILAADYSQIELRIMAHLSNDEGLLSAFQSGEDIHKATAAEVFGVPLDQVTGDQRRAAKAINFGLMYGMSAFGLAKQLNVSRTEAQDYIASYFGRYPGVKRYMAAIRSQAHEQGYVETVFGRRLVLANINARNAMLRAGAERAAINAPMQGTAADIIKRAMISIDAWMRAERIEGDQARMIMQVHDELVFEVQKDFADAFAPQITSRMTAAAELQVPLIVEFGTGLNWEQAH